MGMLISKLLDAMNNLGTLDARFLMVGLDAAGKTTVLYKLKLNETVVTQPTIGFNCETVKYKAMEMTMFDVGGQTKLRSLWHHYYEGSEGVLFVVDSSDPERLDIAAEELQAMVASERLPPTASILVLANKQDLPDAKSPAEIASALHMSSLPSRHRWYVQGCCANTGDGLYEGLDWLYDAVKTARK